MNKINVAIFFGGCSSEYSVSLESASSVIRGLNRERYHLILVGITRQGDWYHYTGDLERIPADTWHEDHTHCVPAALSPSRSAHELLVYKAELLERLPVDVALPILHGKGGEDGTLQGLIELAGIPLAGCGTLASALCMDKDRAHRLVSLAGICTPRALVLDRPDTDQLSSLVEQAEAFAHQAGFPLYVKPVKAGSSYGVSRALSSEQLQTALELAFCYDDQVILEESIAGFEVGCAVLGTRELITGEVDEIELSGGFFDYTEKYTLQTAAIHVPARIAPDKARELKLTAAKIYRALGCSGFARVDMFLTPEGRIVFNEVNTIPGFTEHSRYPGMMRAAGIPFSEVLDRILSQALQQEAKEKRT
ncbi:MAG: D-alanine--D-serine ligase VanG [bacterium]|nr:D-alanine--D-serine ligase VanG [bacterium]MCM1375325.1 D-alanine--D-serine ligase VanG [Muribaculum sp.]MCM1409758.1 D-alanine--D-serine ligase VanG [Lachnospiraceae bacterium]